MPNFRYQALTESGEVVSGLISASTAAEVARRIDYLRLVPIEAIKEETPPRTSWFGFAFETRVPAEAVTNFTLDLALLLRAGARMDDALELLATDAGRLGPILAKVRTSILSGESLAEALAHHNAVFSPLYVALVRVGEAAGTLDRILEMLANERLRSETLRRKIGDALRYPVFLLFAALSVLIFFLMFVMPQFGAVLKDFGGKLDTPINTFLRISDVLNSNKNVIGSFAVVALSGAFLAMRYAPVRTAVIGSLSRVPLCASVFSFYRTGLFCRNLSVLLAAQVPLTTALRVLVDMMASLGDSATWTQAVEQVRHGRKLSDVMSDSALLPPMAARMLRLGEETGQLSVLSARVAELYEAKLQRRLDRIVGVVGPVAIVVISIIVGGLIASVMTSLLSVNQLVG